MLFVNLNKAGKNRIESSSAAILLSEVYRRGISKDGRNI